MKSLILLSLLFTSFASFAEHDVIRHKDVRVYKNYEHSFISNAVLNICGGKIGQVALNNRLLDASDEVFFLFMLSRAEKVLDHNPNKPEVRELRELLELGKKLVYSHKIDFGRVSSNKAVMESSLSVQDKAPRYGLSSSFHTAFFKSPDYYLGVLFHSLRHLDDRMKNHPSLTDVMARESRAYGTSTAFFNLLSPDLQKWDPRIGAAVKAASYGKDSREWKAFVGMSFHHDPSLKQKLSEYDRDAAELNKLLLPLAKDLLTRATQAWLDAEKLGGIDAKKAEELYKTYVELHTFVANTPHQLNSSYETMQLKKTLATIDQSLQANASFQDLGPFRENGLPVAEISRKEFENWLQDENNIKDYKEEFRKMYCPEPSEEEKAGKTNGPATKAVDLKAWTHLIALVNYQSALGTLDTRDRLQDLTDGEIARRVCREGQDLYQAHRGKLENQRVDVYKVLSEEDYTALMKDLKAQIEAGETSIALERMNRALLTYEGPVARRLKDGWLQLVKDYENKLIKEAYHQPAADPAAEAKPLDRDKLWTSLLFLWSEIGNTERENELGSLIEKRSSKETLAQIREAVKQKQEKLAFIKQWKASEFNIPNGYDLTSHIQKTHGQILKNEVDEVALRYAWWKGNYPERSSTVRNEIINSLLRIQDSDEFRNLKEPASKAKAEPLSGKEKQLWTSVLVLRDEIKDSNAKEKTANLIKERVSPAEFSEIRGMAERDSLLINRAKVDIVLRRTPGQDLQMAEQVLNRPSHEIRKSIVDGNGDAVALAYYALLFHDQDKANAAHAKIKDVLNTIEELGLKQ